MLCSLYAFLQHIECHIFLPTVADKSFPPELILNASYMPFGERKSVNIHELMRLSSGMRLSMGN